MVGRVVDRAGVTATYSTQMSHKLRPSNEGHFLQTHVNPFRDTKVPGEEGAEGFHRMRHAGTFDVKGKEGNPLPLRGSSGSRTHYLRPNAGLYR